MRISNTTSPSKTINLSLNLFKINNSNNNTINSSLFDDVSTIHGSDDDDSVNGNIISSTSFTSTTSSSNGTDNGGSYNKNNNNNTLNSSGYNNLSFAENDSNASKNKSFQSTVGGKSKPPFYFNVAQGILQNILGEKEFYDEYQEGDIIGQGADSYVTKIKNKKTNELFACKIVPKLGTFINIKNLQQEIRVLTSIQHPNIISLRQVYETPQELRLVMDLATGGELFDRIVKKEKYSEFEACEVMIGILSAASFLHDRNIIHRDIKPENILLATEDNDTFIKLTDFGIAKILQAELVDENSPRAMDIDTGSSSNSSSSNKFFSSSSTSLKSRMRTYTAVGSDYYIAPEILKGDGYDKQVDMWSIGVVMYILLCGFPPFHDQDGMGFYTNILNAKFDFPLPYWEGVTEAAKDLINRLLTADPEKRIKAKEALAHPWILSKGTLVTNNPLSPQRYTMFQKFNSTRKMEISIGS